MESTLLFIFGSILFLMFLGMLYGDQLSMLGLFDGRIFAPVGSVFGRIVSLFTEGFERGVEFVLAHLSWVIAAVSGFAGLLLIIFLMGGGLTADAAVYHQDVRTPLHSGGVIDQLTPVPSPVPQDPIKLAEHVRDDSRLVFQVKTADYLVFGRPEFSRPWRPPATDVAVDDRVNRPITDRPFLDIQFRRLGSSMLMEDEIPEAVVRGRLVDPLPSVAFVRRAVDSLRNDNWNDGTLRRDPDDLGLPQDSVPNATNADIRNFEALVAESRVRVIPGLMVSEQDIRVEKSTPSQSDTGEVEMQIRIKNLSQETIRGLLVREIMPLETQVRAAVPDGLLRDDTMTWLIDELRSGQEETLRFVVIPSTDAGLARRSFFESMTEVSALTAVTASTKVGRGTPDPFPSDRRRPREVAGAPDLRMSIEEPETPGRVGEWSTYFFVVRNVGTATAEDVVVRLILDKTLDQPDLLENPREDHNVFALLTRIRPNEERRVRLEVRPRRDGVTSSTADLMYQEKRLDSKRFRLVVEAAPATSSRLSR